MKKLLLLCALLLLGVSTLFANGESEKNVIDNSQKGTETTKYLESHGEKEWAYVDSKGNVAYKKAEDGESAPTNVIGVRYIKDGKVTSTLWYTQETSLIGQWIDTIANAIDQITYYLIMSIHPFPSTLFQLYDTNIGASSGTGGYTMKIDESTDWSQIPINNFETDYLLIDNNYYNSRILSDNKSRSDSWIVPISEEAASGGLQKQKWSIVTVLFLTLFIAEILFTTIWGYVTGSTENVLKEVAKKAGITLALFILVSALPFLVEAMRFGFFTIADTFYGTVAENYYEDADMNVSLNSPGEVFQLPGEFLRKMKVFFVASNSERGEKALSATLGDDNSSNSNALKKIVIWVLYTVYRFFMFFAVLKGALHIAVNILEVYILLGVTMILVPFSVFEPLKPIGAKCVMSLVTNIIECFIIIVILTCVVPAVILVCSNMLNGIDNTNDEIIHSYGIVTYGNSNIQQSQYIVEETSDKESARSVTLDVGQNFILLTVPIKAEYKIGFVYRDSAEKNENSFALTQTKQEAKQLDTLGVNAYYVLTDNLLENNTTNTLTFSALQGTLMTVSGKTYDETLFWSDYQGTKEKDYKEAVGKVAYAYLTAICALKQSGNTFIGDVNQRTEFSKALSSSLTSSENQFTVGLGTLLIGTKKISGNMLNPEAEFKKFSNASTFSSKIYNQSYNVTMFLQLTVIFMGMYIPVFFVQQSTMITNSLMNGTAAMESFANAIGGELRNTFGMARKVGESVISLGGNISKTITGLHNMNTATSTAQQQKSMAENVQSIASGMQKLAEASSQKGSDNDEKNKGSGGTAASDMNK